MDFSKTKSAFFIGIGGIGISAIARMFVMEGKSVSGSDMAESEVTLELRKAGVRIFLEESAQNIPADCDLVIYTIAVLKQGAPLSDKGAPCSDHTELVEAKKRGITVLSYPEALGIISKDKYTIAIVGTHGKTTTTAMVAKILMDAGLDPTVIVGSFMLESPFKKGALHSDAGGLSQPPKTAPFSKGDTFRRTNFVAGKSKYLVVEGCEYRRSFLNLSPKILVVTNIDADHLDYYKDLDDIKSAFAELTTKLPQDGVLINNFSAIQLPKDFKLRIPGKHNLENAKAALAVAKVLGIPEEKAFKSLSEFRGTWRRFEYRGKAGNGALVYDDYGHHPTEIAATLQGARELFPLNKGGVRVGEDGGCISSIKGGGSGGLSRKIVVVFQPHLYSRTKDHLVGFGTCFKQADEVILLPIYPAREIDPGDISSEMVVSEIKKNGQSAYFVKTFAEAASTSAELAGSDGIILTMGAGETNKVADLLVN